MTSTIQNDITTYDPFAPENYGVGDVLSEWRPMPTASEPGRLIYSNDPFEPPPLVPEGYEPIPGDPHSQYCEDDRAIRPILAGPAPKVVLPPLADDQAETDVSAGLYEPPVPDSDDASTAPRPTQRPKRKAAPRSRPTTGVVTVEPIDQNEHTLAMINSHQLTRLPQLVGMVASVELAITASRQGVPFGQAERELTAGYLAMLTGLSERSARDAMRDAVLLGYFERLDNGQGGKRDENGTGRNRAVYRPRLPAFVRGNPASPAG
ncbi:hypothetical protein [Pseudonocardia hydrocarbonoxydans]|uniref:Uncharacterized protein n=1 Tax=Pseudonocardia hydrocarbonoxydans TaxID=76726 RepID=A0A4Y3WV90_9PSEU|nr:hypothetical protein [Pseudonocardia hydrocarbonoxydans]GEC22211.1 hypothetical protein PHY01_44940 [Pseudonocardia hydrocarbonoxydans]